MERSRGERPGELAAARDALDRQRVEVDRLRERLAELEAERQRACDEYVAALDRATEIGNRYVALHRLHGSMDRAEILAAIREIVVNLVGSEELAILERRGDRLEPALVEGVSPERLGELGSGAGPIARAAAAGRVLAGGEAAEHGLAAWVPLRIGDEVVGAIAIFGLLAHKPGLGAADAALLELLSTHAALALRRAALLEGAA